MLRVSKKMFYAVEAVLYIAYNATSEPISSRTIAQRQNLQPRYLEQIMQQLVRAGILRGVRGPKGGYVLARERRRITLADVCNVVREMDEADATAFAATPLSKQIVYPLCRALEDELSEQLKDTNLASLCEQASHANIRRDNDDHTSYAI